MPGGKKRQAAPLMASGCSDAGGKKPRAPAKSARSTRSVASDTDETASVAASNSGTIASNAVYEHGKAGHGKCVVCQASSKTTRWAATRKQDGQPLGNLCEECVNVWKLRQGPQLPTLDSFVAQAAKSKDFRREIEKTKQLQRGEASRDFEKESCSQVLQSYCEVLTPFVALTERELLKLVKKQNASRLPKYMTKDLISISLPTLGNATVREQHFLFQHPDRPRREVIFRQAFGMQREVHCLDESAAVYKGQGDTKLVEGLQKVVDLEAAKSAQEKNTSASLLTLDEYINKMHKATEKAAKPPKENSSDDGSDSSGSSLDDDDDEISGPLASMYASPSEPKSRSKKDLPPVPMFTPPSTKRATSAGELSDDDSQAASTMGKSSRNDDGKEDPTAKVVRMEGDHWG